MGSHGRVLGLVDTSVGVGERVEVRRIVETDPPEMVIDMIHRMRNPLAAIKSGVFLVVYAAQPSGEVAEYLDEMLNEVGRIDKAMRGMQRFVLLTKAKMSRMKVTEVVAEVMLKQQEEAQIAGVALAATGDEAVEVVGDSEQLRFALGELMSNALRATPAGLSVNVSWRVRESGSVGIEIEDACGGIPPTYADKIGRPFFSSSSERSGLGLATVSRICRLAGGRLEWSNLALNLGCRFSLVLPTP